ncbi:gastrula zinc finger protein XlCGF57.1-like isoform X1 [Thalassophryne amazonica]|uniref:gastrula zinc finger protein XlCGF57.1-like isoform X1 n=2 Tax=Thalassophryne amazonica TaxID=390379 RepID=UPI0014726A1E|nr:gastrula zinc finger protein XlCGF57.1-like isoform X1 [Thalassophryne amazonica]
MPQHLMIKEDICEWQKENPNLDQNYLQLPNIKEEQEELWCEDEEKLQSYHIHQSQRRESIEMEHFSSNSTEHRTQKIEAHGEDCGGSQPASNSGSCPHLQPQTDDMQQLLLIKEEFLPEQQERNLSVDQEVIKEEPENMCISQQGQQLHQVEEADITEFSFTAVPMKTEHDEKPQSSQLHHNTNDERTEAEHIASRSTVNRTLTAQADEEDYGRPEPASNSGPYSHLALDTNGRFSDSSDTDNGCEWMQIREFNSSFNGQKKHNVSVIHCRGNITKTQFHFSECEKACGHVNYSKQNTGMQANEKPFSCSECGKRFALKDSLITHIRIHQGEKPFGCSVCHIRFRKKEVLHNHMKIHTGQKAFGCSVCGKRFGKKSTLITHLRIHSGEKPFACSDCDKRFGRNNDLIAHLRIHRGEKPFDCSECGSRFRRKGNLIRHMRIHTGEKPFACSKCEKRFGQKDELIAHLRIHTGEKPFDCSACGIQFRRKCNLLRHMRIHTGEKPFVCFECGKGFGQKDDLTKHMRIHTGEKPFGCSECSKRFGLKGNLIRHMRVHAMQETNLHGTNSTTHITL